MSGRARLLRTAILAVALLTLLASGTTHAWGAPTGTQTALTWDIHRVKYAFGDPDTNDVHDLGGSVIVWNSDHGVVAYDARTRRYLDLVNPPQFEPSTPRTDGASVIGRLSADRIGLYDLTDGSLRSFDVSSNPLPHIAFGSWTADVSGGRVAYLTGPRHVGVADISRDFAPVITVEESYLSNPVMADDLVVAAEWDSWEGAVLPSIHRLPRYSLRDHALHSVGQHRLHSQWSEHRVGRFARYSSSQR